MATGRQGDASSQFDDSSSCHEREQPSTRPEPTNTDQPQLRSKMRPLYYFPLDPAFFSILVGALAFLFLLLQVRAFRYAYMSVGLSSRAAMLVLLGSLIGSYFNVPLFELPEQQIVSNQIISYYGVHYVVPVAIDRPGTIVALNVGGAVIPGLVSIYLLVKNHLWGRGLTTIVCVAAVTHWLAESVPGLGIALPVFVPTVATAITALLLSRRLAAPLAYISGSMGTLIGADLLNLGRSQGLGAPVASIGGAGHIRRDILDWCSGGLAGEPHDRVSTPSQCCDHLAPFVLLRWRSSRFLAAEVPNSMMLPLPVRLTTHP